MPAIALLVEISGSRYDVFVVLRPLLVVVLEVIIATFDLFVFLLLKVSPEMSSSPTHVFLAAAYPERCHS